MAQRAYTGCKIIRKGDRVMIFQRESFDIITLREFLKEEAEPVLENSVDQPYVYSEPEDITFP